MRCEKSRDISIKQSTKFSEKNLHLSRKKKKKRPQQTPNRMSAQRGLYGEGKKTTAKSKQSNKHFINMRNASLMGLDNKT